MAKDDEKVKNALAKIKGKKTEDKKDAPAKDPADEIPTPSEEIPATDEDSKDEVIDILQNAGVYRREMLLRANVQIDLLEKINENLEGIKKGQDELVKFLKS